MAFTIKPLLGQGTLTIYSAFDESIDWEATKESGGPSQDEYIANPWPHLIPEKKLVFFPDVPTSPFKCRAPSELDLEVIDSAYAVRGPSGEIEQRIDPKAENLRLFRRCAKSIQNYTIDGDQVSFEPWEKDTDGCELVNTDALAKLPHVIRAEIGGYLKQSQEVGGDLKNA